MIALLDGYWEGLKTLILTALFNPAFLLFLLAIYFLGKLFGRLVSQPNVWKLILAGYLGIAFIEPIRSLGLFMGGIFLLGFFNGAIRSAPAILAWAGSLGDIFFAFRHRRAFEDIRRRERELEEELRRARAEAAQARAQAGSHESRSQQRWRDEAKQERSKTPPPGGDGRGQSAHGSRGSSQTFNKTSQGQPSDPWRARYLAVLGLDPRKRYSQTEIKAAFRKTVKTAHPDVGGSSEVMREVLAAYDWLTRNKG